MTKTAEPRQPAPRQSAPSLAARRQPVSNRQYRVASMVSPVSNRQHHIASTTSASTGDHKQDETHQASTIISMIFWLIKSLMTAASPTSDLKRKQAHHQNRQASALSLVILCVIAIFATARLSSDRQRKHEHRQSEFVSEGSLCSPSRMAKSPSRP